MDFRILQGLSAKIVYRKWRKLYLLSGKKIEKHTRASNIIVGAVDSEYARLRKDSPPTAEKPDLLILRAVQHTYLVFYQANIIDGEYNVEKYSAGTTGLNPGLDRAV